VANSTNKINQYCLNKESKFFNQHYFLVNFLSNDLTHPTDLTRQNLEAAILGASSVPLASPESPSDINDEADAILMGGGGEAPACPTEALSLQTTPETEESSSSNSAFAERGINLLAFLL